MLDRVLIANRGEIACRVIRTCRKMGIHTIAVYSEADRAALHVALADEARCIGPAPARQSYLNIDNVLQAAQATGAQAIHPGYGFLSENPGFADACAGAGLTFIGPPADAIRAMGSKSHAKHLMEGAGVPLVPGYHGEDQTEATLRRAAADIGFPVLLKPSGGGGGKGMRVVESDAAFADALASACREAEAAFGDRHMLVEKYLTAPRHIEIQVFLDGAGEGVYLFERDCSVQRRHQKIIEEAPAPGLQQSTREAMGEAALDAARAIGYVGAGTVEFIMDTDGTFHFMEMNTRLQVEHPVTEMITGQDLVAWQLRIADGEPLPAAQSDLTITGHAFEARLYAEDPDAGFLPATGTITYQSLPEPADWLRIDSGVRQGDTVSAYYDPLMAKLVVWGEDRSHALNRMQRALARCHIAGPTNNIAFLARVTGHPDFAAGRFDTGFVETHGEALFPRAEPVSDRTLAIATLWQLLRTEADAQMQAAASGEPCSPWHATDGWRLNGGSARAFHYLDGERAVAVHARSRGREHLLECSGNTLPVQGELHADGAGLTLELDGQRLQAAVVADGDSLTVFTNGARNRLQRHDPLAGPSEDAAAPGSLSAPMAGTVISVSAETGDEVRKGQTLIVLEAMKMEHTLNAASDGRVARINCRVGEQVDDGAELIVVEAGE